MLLSLATFPTKRLGTERVTDVLVLSNDSTKPERYRDLRVAFEALGIKMHAINDQQSLKTMDAVSRLHVSKAACAMADHFSVRKTTRPCTTRIHSPTD